MSEIRPHPGPQESFLSTSADIAIYGGQAGGGKTWALIVEPLRHIENPGFGAVIFRRTSPQITREGGLWDESAKTYLAFNAIPRAGMHDWSFPKGCRIAFSAMEYEQDKYDWDGTQIPYIGFDQLEHFTEGQFFYMLSRNRSTCGVIPYIRATANPDPDSWLKKFISWWLDENDQYPDPKKAGKVRYFIRSGDEMVWASNRNRLIRHNTTRLPNGKIVKPMPLSVTFIPASIMDNPTILESDPLYLAKLQGLPLIERQRLLYGDWRVKPAAGLYFKTEYFRVLNNMPPEKPRRTIRWWDLAATEALSRRKGRVKRDPDWSVGVRMHLMPDNRVVISHVKRLRASPYHVEQAIKDMATYDGPGVTVGVSQDPGQAGKSQIESYQRMLAGHSFTSDRETGDKETRAKPFSAAAEFGNVSILKGAWNDEYTSELENFPEGSYDDQVDASSAVYNELTGARRAGTWGRR